VFSNTELMNAALYERIRQRENGVRVRQGVSFSLTVSFNANAVPNTPPWKRCFPT
jgi:hypothetical protein